MRQKAGDSSSSSQAVPAGLRDTHISTACTYQKKVILYQAWDKWIATITFQLKHYELYHKPHMLTLNYTAELKHWGCWSHWKCNHKPGDKWTQLFHPDNKPENTESRIFPCRTPARVFLSTLATQHPFLQGLLARTVSLPVVRDLDHFWIALHVGGCREEQAREKAQARGKLKDRLRKTKGK